MTVDEIVTERQKLATEVLDGSKAEMAKIGLIVDSLQIQSIDDMGTGYIDAMAAPHVSAIQRQAKVAQAQADQASAEAQQASQRKQAEFARQTAVVQAQYKAEVDTAQAEAAQAGPLAQAHAQQEVLAGRPSSPSATRRSGAAARRRDREAGRGRGGEGPHAGPGRRGADVDPCRGRRVAQPRRPRPDADRPAAADRQGGGRRPAGERHHPERRRRPGRDRLRTRRSRA